MALKSALIFLALTVSSISFGESPIPVKSLGSWTIVVAPDAIASEKYAAEEFRDLLKKATGMELAVSDSPRQATGNVFIGDGESFRKSSLAFGIEDLGEEGLHIRITPASIAIVGGRPRGTLYGVYEFMERYLGVRFLTRDHTHFPSPSIAELPCEDHIYRPIFEFRWSYYKENSDAPDFAARMRVNTVTSDDKLGGRTRQELIGHTFGRYLPVEKYGKDHPEYFALVDGVRKLDSGGGGPEPCVSNPAVIDIISSNVLADLEADPHRKNISVSQNDNDAYCRCATCEAINKAEGTPMGSNLALVNAVADRVAEKFPGIKVGTLSYWYTRKPPKTIKPRENVQIQLCSIECCTFHPLNDPSCPKNREFCADMEGWKSICNDIWIWNYNTNFSSYDLPFPNLRAIGPNVRFFSENHVKGVFMQANGNGNAGEMSDLRNYVISRCLWNPSLESWPLAEEFCRLHYGAAAGKVIDYLALLHDNLEQSGNHPACFPTAAEVGLNADISTRAYRLIREAIALADNDEVKSRLEKFSIYPMKAVLETAATMSCDQGTFRCVLPDELKDVPRQYIDLCKRFNLTMAAETIPIEVYLDAVERAVEGIPALALENAVWRIKVIPEQNGRMVELFHKPSGKHMLAASGDQNHGISFRRGDCQELWGDPAMRNPKDAFTGEVSGSAIRMKRVLADGSVIQRTIRLEEGRPELVFNETTVTHQSDSPGNYQFKIRPEIDTYTASNDPNVLSVLIKGKDWEQINQSWDKADGPNKDRLRLAQGGEYAFYNHEQHMGMKLTYHPEQATARLWWNPEWEQVNLELMTRLAQLTKGVSWSYDYTLEFLPEPPH